MESKQSVRTKMSRRTFMRAAVGAGAGLVTSSVLPPGGHWPLTTAEVSAAGEGEGTFNWMTWGDHYFPEQIKEAESKYNIRPNPILFGENSEALLKVKQVGGKQVDMVGGDGLWITKYYEEGLIEPFDLLSLDCARGLWDVALDLPFLKSKEGADLAFPFGWSPVVVAYNPKYVTGDPDSWEVLWDPKYRGRIAMQLQPTDIMAMMGKSLGYSDVYDMTSEQIDASKQQLIDLMPNILTFTEQHMELFKLLADESVWIATQHAGGEDVIRDMGGPEIKTFVPKEGIVGWMDGEMIVKDAENRAVAMNFLDKMESPEWLAKNFLEHGRPLFSREAYYWLVKNGYEEQAKRRMMDKPELILSMSLKGPASDMEAITAAFNEALATA